MSSNDFFKVEDEINLFLYKSIVKRFKNSRNEQSTLEGAINIEGKCISYINDVAKNSFEKFIELTEFDQLEMNSHGYNIKYINRKYLNNVTIVNLLENKYIEIMNHINTLTNQIKGKIKRINQKKAALNLWKDNIAFVYLEKFLNSDNLKDIYSKKSRLNIDFSQGIAMLPVESEKKISIKDIKIKSGNGKAGNSDIEVTTENQYLSSIIDGDVETYFEYEKLHSGPLLLSLEINFYQNEIINYFEIFPFVNEKNVGFEIEDILFYKDNVGSISIFKLSSLKEIYIKSLSLEEGFDIDFLPVECNSIVIKFKQEDHENIKKTRRLRERKNKRYSMGIREISFKRKAFQVSGELSSADVKLPVPCFIASGSFDIFPENKDLYSLNLDLFFQKRWQKAEIDLKNKTQDFLLEGTESKFSWKMFLEKKISEFANKSSYEEDLSEMITKVKSFNKKINPCIIPFEGQVKEENISVLCSTGVSKTNDRKNFKILKTIKSESMKLNLMIDGVSETSDGSRLNIELPISLRKNKINEEEIGIVVNGVEYERVESSDDLAAYKFFVSYKLNCIVFDNHTFPGRGRVQWYLKPELLKFEQDSNYFYSKFSFFPNPNKKNMSIYYLSSLEKEKEVSMTLGVKKFFLEEGIIKDSLTLISNLDIVFSEQTSRKNLKTYSGNDHPYYFEEESGILYFKESLSRKGIHKIRYKVRERKKMNDFEYEIWEKESVPVGIKIKKSKFFSEKVNQNLYSDIERTFSVRTNQVVEESDLFGNGNFGSAQEKKVFKLNHPRVIKNSIEIKKGLSSLALNKFSEIDFIDGESEFLNLIHVEDERTNAILGNNTGLVTFNLSAGTLFYDVLGVEFEQNNHFRELVDSKLILENAVNADPQGSIGKYFISKLGEVSVCTSLDGIPEGIKMSYYYTFGEVVTSDKYSVDYDNSIIYFSQEVDISLAAISYRICNYSAEYDILSFIEDRKIDFVKKQVLVNSEEFPTQTGRVFVFYKSNTSKYNLRDMAEYFSPIVYSFKMDFK